MASLNKTMIIGNLTKRPDIRTTGGGTSVANFSVAVNEKVKRNGEWIDHTEYFDVVFFGKTAEVCGNYLDRGHSVYVEGPLRKEKYEKDGVEKLAVKLYGEKMQMLSGKGEKREPQGSGEPQFDQDEMIPF